MTFGTEKL